MLITLGVIGIICAITLPALIQGQQEKATVTTLKKAYSTLTNAFNLAVYNDGPPSTWDLKGDASGEGAENMLNKLAPYLNITKNCGRYSGCLPDTVYKYLNGDPYGNFDANQNRAKARLADGSLIMTYAASATCTNTTVCGYIRVDINGDKKPNQIGVDMFFFNVTNTQIVPYGVGTNANCKDKSTDSGWMCTAWVIYKENLDYLHCNNLSWKGPTKCQ